MSKTDYLIGLITGPIAGLAPTELAPESDRVAMLLAAAVQNEAEKSALQVQIRDLKRELRAAKETNGGEPKPIVLETAGAKCPHNTPWRLCKWKACRDHESEVGPTKIIGSREAVERGRRVLDVTAPDPANGRGKATVETLRENRHPPASPPPGKFLQRSVVKPIPKPTSGKRGEGRK